jgi:FkbM family methyltransferase
VQENKLPPPNFIKLDVQGAELDILTGSEGLLECTS